MAKNSQSTQNQSVNVELTAKEQFLAKRLEQSLKAYETKLIKDKEREDFLASGKIRVATTNKRTLGQIEKTKEYNAIEGKGFHSSNDALNQSSKDIDLESASYSKKINTFLKQAKKRLSKIDAFSKSKELTFAKVNAFKLSSEKFSQLTYVSSFQANQIVKAYIVSIDGNVARAQKLEKQGGLQGKKADLMSVNSSK